MRNPKQPTVQSRAIKRHLIDFQEKNILEDSRGRDSGFMEGEAPYSRACSGGSRVFKGGGGGGA